MQRFNHTIIIVVLNIELCIILTLLCSYTWKVIEAWIVVTISYIRV